jgi:hypothetical protein
LGSLELHLQFDLLCVGFLGLCGQLELHSVQFRLQKGHESFKVVTCFARRLSASAAIAAKKAADVWASTSPIRGFGTPLPPSPEPRNEEPLPPSPESLLLLLLLLLLPKCSSSDQF